MKLTIETFARFWSSYINSIENVIKYWDSNNEWTNKILYPEKSGCFLLKNRINEAFNGLITEFEYRKIDIVIYSREKFSEIDNYDNPEKTNQTDIPVGLEAIIEHENDYRMAFEEIRKLTEIKAKLKILITYPIDEKSEKALCNKFLKGIQQANSFFAENSETNYLLICGYKEEAKITWKYFKLCKRGEWTIIEFKV